MTRRTRHLNDWPTWIKENCVHLFRTYGSLDNTRALKKFIDCAHIFNVRHDISMKTNDRKQQLLLHLITNFYANILIRLILTASYSTPLNLHRRTVRRYLPTSTTSWSVSFTPRSLVFLTASQNSIRDTLYIGDVEKPTAERYCHTKLVYNVWLQHLSPPAASSDFRTFVLSTVTW